jgi:hypothetical protein
MEAGSRLLFRIENCPPTPAFGFPRAARRIGLSIFAGLLIAVVAAPSEAADQRTQNFIVQAPTPALAQAVAKAAEKYRHDLAIHWLGGPLAPWPRPCPIRVVAGPNLAAQGVTTYNPRPVRDFQMEVVGTPERILDSVLPHEVTHTVLATYFGRPLPRWADEGICTTVEHAAERNKHEAKLREFLRSRRGIAMNQLFLMTEYPNDVLPMYAQGYSVCRFLIAQKGPRTFIQFLQDSMDSRSWTASVKKYYDYDSLRELQQYWLAWVDEGSADVTKFAKISPQPQTQLASATETVPDGPATMAVASSALNDLALNDARGDLLAASVGGGRVVGPTAGAAALASTNSSGWYQRRRAEVVDRGPASVPVTQTPPAQSPAASTTLPPSVRNSGRYSAAQPQPEQRFYGAQQLPQQPATPPQQRFGSPQHPLETPNTIFR